jgi:peptidoglycan hydrolase-like protein with peptidoglycan-binding domain
MKFIPTVPLALALAAGIAGTAAAQTPATPGAASNSPQTLATPTTQPGPTAQPGMNYRQTQPSYTQTDPSLPAGAGMPGATMMGTSSMGTAPTGLAPSLSGQPNPQNSSADQVRTAQEQLHTAGLYRGPVDGLMDPDTRAAIARFQQENGMQRSGMLDQATLDRLATNRTSGSGSGAPGASLAAPNANQGPTTAPMGAGGTNAPGNQIINR